jgi:hypothetical protein
VSAIDDTVVISLFGSGNVNSSTAHIPQTISTVFDTPGEALEALYQAFESHKHRFGIRNRHQHLQAAKAVQTIVTRDRHTGQHFRRLPPDAQQVMEWCVNLD